MRLFAEEYPQEEFMQQVAAQLPWFHHCVLLDKVKSYEERCWYIQKTAENGWSRNVLTLHIENKLYHRQGKAITNFKSTLPATDSDLAQEIFKSTYNLEFLDLDQHTKERTLEKALVGNIRDFLLELGTGFAFMGNQYKVVIGDEEFFIDLLFYNTRLRCYVVIELKVGKFLPEYAGKLGFYLTLIDRRMKHASDNPTIGIILCQSAKDVVVEYSLSGSTKPMGVSQYQVGTSLPKEFDQVLPSPEALKSFLSRVSEDEWDE